MRQLDLCLPVVAGERRQRVVARDPGVRDPVVDCRLEPLDVAHHHQLPVGPERDVVRVAGVAEETDVAPAPVGVEDRDVGVLVVVLARDRDQPARRHRHPPRDVDVVGVGGHQTLAIGERAVQLTVGRETGDREVGEHAPVAVGIAADQYTAAGRQPGDVLWHEVVVAVGVFGVGAVDDAADGVVEGDAAAVAEGRVGHAVGGEAVDRDTVGGNDPAVRLDGDAAGANRDDAVAPAEGPVQAAVGRDAGEDRAADEHPAVVEQLKPPDAGAGAQRDVGLAAGAECGVRGPVRQEPPQVRPFPDRDDLAVGLDGDVGKDRDVRDGDDPVAAEARVELPCGEQGATVEPLAHCAGGQGGSPVTHG